MPHQCVRCGAVYEDNSSQIIRGCSCGSKLFYYVSKERLEFLRRKDEKSKQEIQEAENDVLEILGSAVEEIPPVLLETGSVRVIQPGKYELDVVKLFREKVPIFEISEGKFVIDIDSAFKGKSNKKSKLILK
ncbi:MAG: Zn-ribbon containing protein [Candidatus Woesearchaeota archaeon]